MAKLQEVEGHFSVYEVLDHLGEAYPSRAWRRLKKDLADQLPPHTKKQFLMKDGRKSRFLPAIAVQHFDLLMRLLEQVRLYSEPSVLQLNTEEALLKNIAEAFQDFDPVFDFEVGDLRLDVYFQRSRVGVALVSSRVAAQRYPEVKRRAEAMGTVLGGVVLVLRMEQHAEQWGSFLFELRQVLVERDRQSR